MAEWLGTALQKLLQRFEPASDLRKPVFIALVFYIVGMLSLLINPKLIKNPACQIVMSLINLLLLEFTKSNE